MGKMLRFKLMVGCIFKIVALIFASLVTNPAQTFTVATYNLENYIDHVAPNRPLKSSESKIQIAKIILSFKPDVIALQEIGLPSALKHLQKTLVNEGITYPYVEHVGGWDTNIFLGLLSKFPIVSRTPHTNDFYILNGKRYQVSRGFMEVKIKVNETYYFTLINVHLKSRRQIQRADEAQMRLQEAKILRKKIDAIFKADPNVNLIVLGDFNDTKNSPVLRTVIGSGKHRLLDTRPAERNGDSGYTPGGKADSRVVTWTHYYSEEDSYERVDYILLSPGMANEWISSGTYVVTYPDWGIASDHRPIVAEFYAEDR